MISASVQMLFQRLQLKRRKSVYIFVNILITSNDHSYFGVCSACRTAGYKPLTCFLDEVLWF